RIAERQRLLDIDVRPCVHRHARERPMRSGRRRNVHDVRLFDGEELLEIVVVIGYAVANGHLLRHQYFEIAHRYDARDLGHFLDFFDVAVGDLAAADDGYAQRHDVVALDTASPASAACAAARRAIGTRKGEHET